MQKTIFRILNFISLSRVCKSNITKKSYCYNELDSTRKYCDDLNFSSIFYRRCKRYCWRNANSHRHIEDV